MESILLNSHDRNRAKIDILPRPIVYREFQLER